MRLKKTTYQFASVHWTKYVCKLVSLHDSNIHTSKGAVTVRSIPAKVLKAILQVPYSRTPLQILGDVISQLILLWHFYRFKLFQSGTHT